ncbi:unnamed protein product [Didymodactylos carnosus]|uniref:Innexin n=1 Tax=Didymodactylos carnosus TaxID=1234261 RepID=A0A8S2I327_9BILA|nr:unnamed protein product [Didymodactylos carnosus]CAF3709803.1 unnamed protein product [Didymodactylos carnosus]
MSLYLITEAFNKLGSPTIRNDDFFDRISRRYSVVIIGISFLIISTCQFIGDPINCYTQNVEGNHMSYVNQVCWISGNSYYLPFEKSLPNRYEIKPNKVIYYQWVPFILLGMMMLFSLPSFIWVSVNRSCGVNTKTLTNLIENLDHLNPESRQPKIRTLIRHIDKALVYHHQPDNGLFSHIRTGNYLTGVYIIVKFLYIFNSIGQLFLLNIFIGKTYSRYGLDALKQWYYETEMLTLEYFPRVTMCKFTIRTLADNIQNYDVQCLLSINIYNEKIFLFLWFWLTFVAIVSIYGLLKWFYYFTIRSRIQFIEEYLKVHSHHSSPQQLKLFLKDYCRQDGLLLLRIISKNTNKIVACEIICELWDIWKIKQKINSSMDNDGLKLLIPSTVI